MRGRDIRAFRVEHKLTQEQVRVALGWETWKLPAIENEKALPQPDDEVRIIEAIKSLSAERLSATA